MIFLLLCHMQSYEQEGWETIINGDLIIHRPRGDYIPLSHLCANSDTQDLRETEAGCFSNCYKKAKAKPAQEASCISLTSLGVNIVSLIVSIGSLFC